MSIGLSASLYFTSHHSAIFNLLRYQHTGYLVLLITVLLGLELLIFSGQSLDLLFEHPLLVEKLRDHPHCVVDVVHFSTLSRCSPHGYFRAECPSCPCSPSARTEIAPGSSRRCSMP